MNQSRISRAGLCGIAFISLVPFAVSCSASSPETESEPVAESSQPIAGGTNSNETSVGVLYLSGGGKCSGTLVGQRTAISAAHCASPYAACFCLYPDGVARVPPNGTCATSSPGDKCSWATVLPNPGYHDGDDDASADNDVSIVRLVNDLTPVTTAFPRGVTPMMIGGPVAEGEVVTLVGYGLNVPGSGWGRQRAGNNRITGVDDQRISYDIAAGAYDLEGDSGGPAFPVSNINCVIAADSRGDSTEEMARVDTKVSWILGSAGDTSIRACGQPSCGDGFCQAPEVCGTCPQDCGACPPPPPPPRCGDGICNGNESHNSCPHDCAAVSCPTGKSDCCETGACLTPRQCQLQGC